MPLLKEGEEQEDRDALYWHYPHYSNQGGFPGRSPYGRLEAHRTL